MISTTEPTAPEEAPKSMAHQRLRPFNTRETYPEQALDNDLSQGVVARGTMVFLRGQVSQDLESRESLHVGDLVVYGLAVGRPKAPKGQGEIQAPRCFWVSRV